MRAKGRKLLRKRDRTSLRGSRWGRFESLEARQMLNAAPVANDDAYTVAEDVVLNAGSTLPQNVIPVRWGENGHYYVHVPGSYTSWRDVETAAASMTYWGSQGHQVSLTSAAEETFVLGGVINHLPQESRVYAGLTDRDVEGQWKWVSGEPLSYSHWRPGEPTTGINDEDFMALYYFSSGWLWGDIPDNGNYPGSYIVEFDGPFADSPLANDTDADNDALSAVLVDGPDNGTLELKANGSFTYTPNPDFAGADSFTYRANDGQVDSNIAKVTINVTPNAAPIAKNDTYSVAEDTTLKVGETNLPSGVVPQQWGENGHYYAFVAGSISWTDANVAATGLKFLGSSGRLVSITSQAEQDFLTNSVLQSLRDSHFNIWIGLTDVAVEGDYRWITGEPFAYSNWQPGEPNSIGEQDDYVHLVEDNGKFPWNDRGNLNHDGYVVEFQGPFAFPLLDNDTDAEGDPLTPVAVAGPQNGSLMLAADGTFTYTPNAQFVGADTFTYKVNDGESDSNVATVTINVTAVNDAPIAKSERYVTAQNQPLNVSAAGGVLTNDSDEEGEPLSAVLVTGTSKGQLTLAPDGSFTYTPNAGYFGPDSFTYQASDGNQSSKATSVSLFVTNPNNVAPVAQNDSYTTAEDTVLLGQPLLPGGIIAQKWSENGHYYAHVTSATHWTDAEAAAANMTFLGAKGHLVTINSATEETFLISSFLANWVANPVFIGLTDRVVEGDFRWITGEPLTYTNWNPGEPNDAGSGQDYANIAKFSDGKWRWDDVWSAPHFGSYLVEFDGPFKGGVLSNDTDSNGDALSAVLAAPPQHGTVTLKEEGTFVYTPNANYNGPDSFTYKARDGQFDSNVATVNITVTAVNDAPSVAPDSYSVVEGSTLTKDAAQGVLANDTDLEGDAFKAAIADGPQHGKVTLNADGSFTYTPNEDFFGVDTFTYRASDEAASQPATVTILVSAVNDAPVAVDDTMTLNEDTSFTFTGPTPQGFTPVKWSANGHYYALVRTGTTWANAKAAAEALRFQGSQGHLVSVGSDAEHQFLVASVLTGFAQRYWIGLTDEGSEGNFRWTTGEPVTFTNWGGSGPDNANGNEHYVEVVHDAGTPFWRWNDINATFTGNGYVVEFEGPFNRGVLANDTDVDRDPLTAQLVAGPSNGKLAFNADGTFTYTPNADFTGTDSFTYKASDGQVESNTATVTLNVVPGNDPPVAVADNYFVADKLTVTAANGVLKNDTDVDSSKASLIAQLVTPPSHGTLTLAPDGSFTYTRGLTFSGSDSFTYRTSDGSATSAPVTVTISAALRLRTENVTIVSQPLAPVEGFFDVYLDVAPGFDFAAAGYDVALRTPAGSGITLVSAAAPSAAHPSLFATPPTFIVSGGTLRVTDALATGTADVDNGDGLFRVRFTVAPETVGDVPLLFTTAFTNLADENGNPLPIDRIGGTIAVTEPPAPKVTGVLVRGTEWTNPFLNSIHTQGLGHAIAAGAGQLTDLPWVNIDQVIVQFNEHVSVQQADLLVHGVNNTTYAISGFNYNPATFTATWTLEDALPAEKVRIQLAAGGADPIRNAAGVRLDGDWTDGTSAYPSGNGRSGGDFQFRFDVLPGNVDQTGPVNIFDTIKTRNRQFTTVGDANYSPLYDVNGSGEINIFDTVQVRNHQFTSLPEGEPGGTPAPAPAISSAPPTVMIRTENVTITSQSSAVVEGVFDVYVDVIPGGSVSVAGYDVALRTPAGSGVTLVSAGLSSPAHPALFTSEPTDFVSQNMLGVTDALPTGAAQLDHHDGLFSVRFSVAPGMVGSVPLAFNTAFTNLADAQGNPVPINVEPGVITVTSPPITITGTSGNDTYHVLRSGSQLRIYENTPPVGDAKYTVDLATMPSAVVIDAGAGDDTLTVDPGASTALGLHQLIYNAGSGANALVLASGSARIDSTAAGGTLGTTLKQAAQLSTQRLQQNALALEDNSRVTLLPSDQTSVITSLALGAGAKLDIGTAALVVDYAGASPQATIRQQILAGRGGSGLGASWHGAGITSSAVAQANQAEPESRSVGFAENATLPLGPYTTFRGVAVDDTAVLIAYVQTADANLDGVVNDDDVTVVGATYAPGAANSNWAAGDFDFNGFVDDDDVTLLGVFYNPTAAAPTPLSMAVDRGVVSGEWSRIDHDLVDLLAESIHADGEIQRAKTVEPHRQLARRSSTADRLWTDWRFDRLYKIFGF